MATASVHPAFGVTTHPATATRFLLVLIPQGLYFFATGLWPLIHMESFLAFTGPKTDVWLVRTVGVLVAVIGFALLVAAFRRQVGGEVRTLAIGSAVGLAVIDVIYVTLRVIPPIYLLDAVAEGVLIAGWALLLSRPVNSVTLRS